MFCCSLYYFPAEDMISLYGLLSLWAYKSQSYDSRWGTNWSKKTNQPTSEPKEPAQTTSLPRHRTAHKQESKRVISPNRETLVLMWKRRLFAARKPCHSPKANCARTCTNTVNAVSWRTGLESFIHVLLLQRKSQMQVPQAPCEGFVF